MEIVLENYTFIFDMSGAFIRTIDILDFAGKPAVVPYDLMESAVMKAYHELDSRRESF
jgi:hypothetical protein